jgi:hypothetical protein
VCFSRAFAGETDCPPRLSAHLVDAEFPGFLCFVVGGGLFFWADFVVSSPWTTTVQCNRGPPGTGEYEGLTIDGTVTRVRVHSVFVQDTAKTKIPPQDLDTLLPSRFNVWTIKATSVWKRALKESDGGEVDPTDRTYIKRRKDGDPSPDSLKITFEEAAKFLSNDNSGKKVMRDGYVKDTAVHMALHPHQEG